jgi:IclR family KDG regulon transcriptional repressor
LRKSDENNVRSINRALQILKCFTWNERRFTLTEIAKKVDLPKSTTSRLLATLENEGFIRRDSGSNYYKLGYEIYFLGLIAKESLDLGQISRPIMEEIGQATKEILRHILYSHNRFNHF